MFFHSRSRSPEFLGMLASDSHSRIVGMDFFHSLPVPEFWEWIFHSLPIPEFWEWFFFHSLPVPELREWFFSIPFPFPNFGNGIIHSRSRSRTPKCHSRSPLLGTTYFTRQNTWGEVAFVRFGPMGHNF